MDHTKMLLQSVVDNARTGMNAVEQMMNYTDDAEMRKELTTEKEQYQAFIRDAEQKMFEMGVTPDKEGMMQKAGMWMGLRMNTLMNAGKDHLAEMIIQGATMGIVTMTRDRNDYTDASADAQGIASNFITTQQDTIDRLKTMLSRATVEESTPR